MTTSPKPKPGIRKVWVSVEMKEALREYCWRRRTKTSPFVVGLIKEVIEFPEHFEGTAVPPAGSDHLSIYVDPAVWEEGSKTAKKFNVALAALLRVGIARELEEEGIPWDVSTPRPRNDHIPNLE